MDGVRMQLNVSKLDHGLYKVNVVCGQQSGVLVHLSQAIESFVIEVVHTSIAVITSAKVTCTFIVKVIPHVLATVRMLR